MYSSFVGRTKTCTIHPAITDLEIVGETLVRPFSLLPSVLWLRPPRLSALLGPRTHTTTRRRNWDSEHDVLQNNTLHYSGTKYDENVLTTQ